MGTDKPLISILLAVYEPRMDWLKIQLDSLNAQTSPHLRLYVRDDCSPTVPYEDIQALVAERITAFPYTIERNEKNLGSNGTFERLTQEAEGDLFAYCDQDDEWLPEKLTVLQGEMKPKTTLSYGDMSVIDSTGKVTFESLRQRRSRLRYVWGENLAETYFFRNCSAGCIMLVRAETAKRALPFPKATVCDQWIATVAALEGEIAFVDQPLQCYRIHGGNQTGVLIGVTSKQSYYERRVAPLRERLASFERYTLPSPELRAFVAARLERNMAGLYRYRALDPLDAKFELAMRLLPEPLFRVAVKIISK